jgi:hypothetical protein
MSDNKHLIELNGQEEKPKVIKKIENAERFTLEVAKVITDYIDAYKLEAYKNMMTQEPNVSIMSLGPKFD